MVWLSLGRRPAPSCGSYTSPESPSRAAPKGRGWGCIRQEGCLLGSLEINRGSTQEGGWGAFLN